MRVAYKIERDAGYMMRITVWVDGEKSGFVTVHRTQEVILRGIERGLLSMSTDVQVVPR